jgi:hypothetical protein
MCGIAVLSGAELPSANAVWTYNLSTQFRVNQNALSSSTGLTNAVALTDGTDNVVVVWLNSVGSQVARIINANGTGITNEFNVSIVPPSRRVVAEIEAGSGGNWCGTWEDGTSILLSCFNYGTRLNLPTIVNQLTYTSVNTPRIARFTTNGTFLVGWAASSAGVYASKARTASSLGAVVSPEFTLCQSSTLAGAPVLASLDNDRVYVTLGCGNFHGAQVWPNTTVVSNASPINISSSRITSVSATGLPGNNAMVFSSQATNILGRSIQNGAPIGNELQVPNNTVTQIDPKTSPVSFGNNGVFIAYGDGNVEAAVFDSSGNRLLNPFTVSNNPFQNAQVAQSVAALPNNRFLVPWMDTTFNTIEARLVSMINATSNPTTASPTGTPNVMPTTAAPTNIPTSMSPTGTPNAMPTTANPTTIPTSLSPTGTPNVMPTTAVPTHIPTLSPTGTPNTMPTTVSPTRSPTRAPTTSSASRLTPGWWLPTKLVSQAFKAVVGLFQQ